MANEMKEKSTVTLPHLASVSFPVPIQGAENNL